MNSIDKTRQSPKPRMAHFVIRTNRYDEMVDWYLKLFDAYVVFRNETITFITFDEEHHRLAIVNHPGLVDSSDGHNAIDHVAFTFDTLAGMMADYERLLQLGIKPIYTLNHGPTTSIYYADPNGNKVEMQVDNYDSLSATHDFFHSQEFAKNFVGVRFDPDVLLAKLKAGESEAVLLKQGSAPVAAAG